MMKLHCLFFFGLLLTGFAEGADQPLLVVPVRVHLLKGLEFSVKGKNIDTWLTPAEFTTSVLPEINRIWKPAHIQWLVESVLVEPVTQSPQLPMIVNRIAQREKVEITVFKPLFPAMSRRPGIIHLYLVPSTGLPNGQATNGGNIAMVALWRKKGPDDLQHAPLVTSMPTLVSIAKTCAHELGHNLGLFHPDERQIERLMQAGPGTLLIEEEITTARQRATTLGK